MILILSSKKVSNPLTLPRPQEFYAGAHTEVGKKQGRAARDSAQAQQEQPAEGWAGGRAFFCLKYSSNFFLAASVSMKIVDTRARLSVGILSWIESLCYCILDVRIDRCHIIVL